jgi:hypothetical protein
VGVSADVRLLAAAGDGVALVERDHGKWTSRRTLDASGRCVAAGEAGVALAGGEDGLWLSRDGGESFERVELAETHVYSVAVSAADGALYAGTEPSRLFRGGGPGEAWEELEALQRIPSRESWSFPPRPWTSHVRWVAPSPHDAGRLLVGIELGGVMLSTDGGASFTDHRPGAVLDCHQLAWHPEALGRAYEAGGAGAASSEDGGERWSPADEGRELHYCWALAVSPSDPQAWWVSAAPGPGRAHGGGPADAHLYRRDGGSSWELVAGPLDSMPYALLALDGELLIGLRDGPLLTSADGGGSWRETGVELGSVLALAAVPA